jgi:hypothetical protein
VGLSSLGFFGQAMAIGRIANYTPILIDKYNELLKD